MSRAPTPPPLRFSHAYGRLLLTESVGDRYVFIGGHQPGYTQNRDHGKFAPGDGKQEASDGQGGHISVSKDSAGYHMRHTDGSGRVVREIHGNKGLGGTRTLEKINNYAQKRGVSSRLSPFDFRESVFRAAAARGAAEANGGGAAAMGHLGHLIGEAAGGPVGGIAGGVLGRGLGAVLQHVANTQQHSEPAASLAFHGTYGRMTGA